MHPSSSPLSTVPLSSLSQATIELPEVAAASIDAVGGSTQAWG